MKKWLRAAAIRAARTAAQAAIAVIGTNEFIAQIDFNGMVSAVAVATLLSVLTSVATKLPELEE